MRRFLIAVFSASLVAALWAQELRLPAKSDSLHFAVIGDTGTGDRAQYEVATQLVRWREKFPFEFLLLLGDNLYGGEDPEDYRSKFEKPYKPLLDAGVKFYASLGNHDKPTQSNYKLFNMDGKRFYTFRPAPNIRFFALDSNYMDKEQLEWLEKELSASSSDWKICFFHHPLYSSGKKHGPSVELRQVLEPLFIKHRVSVVFQGHEHFYERIKPQNGIYYFTSGAGAKLRKGGIEPRAAITSKGFDQDRHFMLVEIAGDEMHFQTISRTGETVDSGVLIRPGSKLETTTSLPSNR
jgi:Calcineurin-like phosphoesterase